MAHYLVMLCWGSLWKLQQLPWLSWMSDGQCQLAAFTRAGPLHMIKVSEAPYRNATEHDALNTMQ